jgi:hypothetical protein
VDVCFQPEPASGAESNAWPNLAAATTARTLLFPSLTSRIYSGPLPHGCLLPPFTAPADIERPLWNLVRLRIPGTFFSDTQVSRFALIAGIQSVHLPLEARWAWLGVALKAEVRDL